LRAGGAKVASDEQQPQEWARKKVAVVELPEALNITTVKAVKVPSWM
jgi:hypothetical protein